MTDNIFKVYPGIAATAAFTTEHAQPAFGSILTIGLAYGMGIALAIICCASTSGGHFNPAITVAFAVWQGFPLKKVPLYIFAQIFGAFVAALILMAQYHEQIGELSHALHKAHKPDVMMGGTASILTTYPTATQHNQGWLFVIEFFVDSFLV
jgi:glycerol uptake facilitator-like aquaporin